MRVLREDVEGGKQKVETAQQSERAAGRRHAHSASA